MLGPEWQHKVGAPDANTVPSDLYHQRPRDQEEYFVDRDGQVYAAILNYLRHGELPQLNTGETDNVGRKACRTGMATLEGLCMPEPQSSQQFVKPLLLGPRL